MVTVEALFEDYLDADDIGAVVHVRIDRLVASILKRIGFGAVYEADVRPSSKFAEVPMLGIERDTTGAHGLFASALVKGRLRLAQWYPCGRRQSLAANLGHLEPLRIGWRHRPVIF